MKVLKVGDNTKIERHTKFEKMYVLVIIFGNLV